MSGAEAVGIMLGFLLIYIVLIGISIASYVMTSYSFYTIAKRRNIKNPWLAWIPIASNWTVGCIANDYDAKNGYNRKWQNVLLSLAIIFYAGFFIMYAIMIASIVSMAFRYGSVEAAELEILRSIIPTYIMMIFALIVGFGWEFCYAICVYKIFESTVPEKALKYILLYLMVPLAGPICLMKCKDKGYPVPQVFENYQE